MLLRCMLKFKRLAYGSDDVTQYNTTIMFFKFFWGGPIAPFPPGHGIFGVFRTFFQSYCCNFDMHKALFHTLVTAM